MGHFYARDRERLFPLALGHLLATFCLLLLPMLGTMGERLQLRPSMLPFLSSLSLSLPFCPFS